MNKKFILQLTKIFCAAIFLAFGTYNVHSIAHVTEGGVLGLMLLLQYWFGISPALSGLVLDGLGYLMGWRTIGKRFLACSASATLGYSFGYAIFEQFPPLYPAIADMPLTAAIVGALFVGIGCGLCVRWGGASSGDDAIAMSLAKITGLPIQWMYLGMDLLVLGLSLTYIPLSKIVYSLITVVLSGQIIGWIQRK